MITQFIIFIGAVLFGYILHSYKTESAKELPQQIKRKLLGSKSGLVEWNPPKSEEEQAEEEIRENLKK